jgi:hypothetical protein
MEVSLTPKTVARPAPPTGRVQIDGQRVRVALDAADLTFRAAEEEIAGAGLGRVPWSSLAKLARSGIVSTAPEVRRAVAAITGVKEDWLSGIGPERSVGDLQAERFAVHQWEDLATEWRKTRNSIDQFRAARAVWEQAAHEARQAFDLALWRRLFGSDAVPTEEEQREFTRHLAQALKVARYPLGQVAGLKRLRQALEQATRRR